MSDCHTKDLLSSPILHLVLSCYLVVGFTGVANAQEYGRQIRLDANTCRNITPEYVRKKNNPLYAKALMVKKTGKLNDMQRRRINEVGFLFDTLKAAKCKIPQ
jgi:hypothetical protein